MLCADGFTDIGAGATYRRPGSTFGQPDGRRRQEGQVPTD
jgi:hypothetical protein